MEKKNGGTHGTIGENRVNKVLRAVGAFGTLRIDQPFNDDVLKFYSAVYGRESEISALPSPTRHLTYEALMNNGHKVLFTGCEVSRFGKIPQGMFGLSLSADTLHVRSGDSCDGTELVADSEWKWKHSLSAFGRTFIAGDFRVSNIQGGQAFKNLDESSLLFRFSENTYGDYGSDSYSEDEIILADPDTSWPNEFERLTMWVEKILGSDLARRVDHFGSTSIPGIPAKPIIDMLVDVPSFDILRREIVPRLCTDDCEYSSFMGHATFIKRTAYNGRRIAHIHMAPKGHDVWHGLAFRDCLRARPDLLQEYASLKRDLASRYGNDRNHYTMGKEKFVQKVHSIINNGTRA